MVRLNLTEEEKEILTTVLESYLSDLRMEIADTDRKAFREMLEERKQVLIKVLDVLRQPRTTA